MVVGAATDVGDFVSDPTFDAWDVILALIIVGISFIFSGIAKRAVLKLCRRLNGISPDLAALAARIVKYFVLFVGVGVALSVLGAPLQPLLTGAIILGVVMVLTLRGVAENFGAGVILQTRHPFVLGDEIDAMGYTGIVEEVSSRDVVIRTFDGRIVHLPNGKLLDGPIVNNSTTGSRRSELEVRASSGTDLAAVIAAIQSAVESADGVLSAPKPAVFVRVIETDRLTLLVQFWHSFTTGQATTGSVVQAIGRAVAADDTAVTVISPPPKAPFTPPATV